MLDLLADPNAWAALVTLSALEIVLGIDNVVFISILVSRLDPTVVARARQIGLGLALVFRILLLFALTALIGLTEPLFTVFGRSFSWHDLILVIGGLFLIAKATHEMHAEIDEAAQGDIVHASFSLIILQIITVDLVASGPVADFVAAHPTTKMLALAFLVLIGVALVADGFDVHIPRGYIYFAMAFAGAVEAFNIVALRKRRKRRRLRSQRRSGKATETVRSGGGST